MESLRVCKVLFLVTFPFHSKSKGKEAGLCQGLHLASMDLLWAMGWTAPPGGVSMFPEWVREFPRGIRKGQMQ